MFPVSKCLRTPFTCGWWGSWMHVFWEHRWTRECKTPIENRLRGGIRIRRETLHATGIPKSRSVVQNLFLADRVFWYSMDDCIARGSKQNDFYWMMWFLGMNGYFTDTHIFTHLLNNLLIHQLSVCFRRIFNPVFYHDDPGSAAYVLFGVADRAIPEWRHHQRVENGADFQRWAADRRQTVSLSL